MMTRPIFNVVDRDTDREAWVAERGDERLEVWFDRRDPDAEGWCYTLKERDAEGYWRETGGDPLDADTWEDPDEACEEALQAVGWTLEVTAR